MCATPSPTRYTIRVRGQPDAHWFQSVAGLVVEHLADGQALLHVPVIDQSALYGLLDRLRDLGLELLAVERKPPAV